MSGQTGDEYLRYLSAHGYPEIKAATYENELPRRSSSDLVLFEGAIPPSAQTIPSLISTGVYRNVNMTPIGSDSLVPVSASTALGEVIFTFTSNTHESTDTTQTPLNVRDALLRIIHLNSKVYKDVLENCKRVLNTIDMNDEDERDHAATRLKDVLGSFSSVIDAIFDGLLRVYKAEAVTTAFLLSQVLPVLDVSTEAQLAIIRITLSEDRASARLAAVQALDSMEVAVAKRLLASAYEHENNRMVRDAIDSSLRAR